MTATALYYYKINVAYQGTHYDGLQLQKDTRNTIQEQIHIALAKFCKSKEFKTRWASRTDSGVHALGQVAQLQIPREFSDLIVLKGMNYYLPADIRLVKVERCSPYFDPKAAALWKEYWYIFSNGPAIATPFTSKLVANCPYPLNWELMERACPLFVGEHDFRHFYHGSKDIKTTIRTLYECELLKEIPQGTLPNFWYPYEVRIVRIRGRGFLKKMVRLIVGSLWTLGRGRIELAEIQRALNDLSFCNRRRLGPAAPAQGLYLKEISFPT